MSIEYVGPIIENAFNIDFKTLFAVISERQLQNIQLLLK